MKATEVIDRLLELPGQMYDVDLEAVDLGTIHDINVIVLKDLKDALDIAVLNARLSAAGQGSNAQERKMAEERAISESAEVAQLRKDISQEEQRLADMAGDKKRKVAYLYKLNKEFDALLAVAALQAGQMKITAANIENHKESKT